MTLSLHQLQQRDRAIATLEDLGADRTIAQQDELERLILQRDKRWEYLPRAIATARRRLRELEAWARQHNLPLERIQS